MSNQRKVERRIEDNHYRGSQLPYYSPDSNARQVHHEETYTHNAPRPAPRPRPARKPVASGKVLVQDVQETIKDHLLTYVVAAAFFAGVALVLALNANVTHSINLRETAGHELVAITASNISRHGELETNIDAAALEYYAVNVLGMVRPEEFQRVEISVPRYEFVAPIEVAGEGFSISGFFRSLFTVSAGN